MGNIVYLDDHRKDEDEGDQFSELYKELDESDDEMSFQGVVAIDLLRAALAQDKEAWKFCMDFLAAIE